MVLPVHDVQPPEEIIEPPSAGPYRRDPRGIENFVQAMNRKAKALGMANTVFVDPTGLSNRNRSTAHDLSLLTAAASQNRLMAEYSTTPQHELAASTGRVLRYNNSNPTMIRTSRYGVCCPNLSSSIHAMNVSV